MVTIIVALAVSGAFRSNDRKDENIAKYFLISLKMYNWTKNTQAEGNLYQNENDERNDNLQDSEYCQFKMRVNGETTINSTK